MAIPGLGSNHVTLGVQLKDDADQQKNLLSPCMSSMHEIEVSNLPTGLHNKLGSMEYDDAVNTISNDSNRKTFAVNQMNVNSQEETMRKDDEAEFVSNPYHGLSPL